jgi:hypothetical protein
MLDANENKSKNASPLKDWIKKEIKNSDKNQFLNTHIIPHDTSFELIDFSNFIAKRKA